MFDTIGISTLLFMINLKHNYDRRCHKNHHYDAGKSSCNVRALTYCDLHKIMRDDLLEVGIGINMGS